MLLMICRPPKNWLWILIYQAKVYTTTKQKLTDLLKLSELLKYEPVHEKTNNLGFRRGLTHKQGVQSQHKARSLKLWIQVGEE